MKILLMCIGVLFFAIVTAVLYAWGLKKSMTREEDLKNELVRVCAFKVVKQLKRRKTLTRREVAEAITGTTAGAIWSRRRIKVQDGKKVSEGVIKYLLEQQYIEEKAGVYRLKKR